MAGKRASDEDTRLGDASAERFLLASNLTDRLDEILTRCRALTDDAEDADRQFREQMQDSPAAWFRDVERLVAGAQDLARELSATATASDARPSTVVLPEPDPSPPAAQTEVREENELDDGWDEAERAERRYQTLVEQVPAIVYTQDAEEGSSDFLYVSPGIQSILGFTPHEWRSSDQWSAQLHPDDRERVWEEASEASASGNPYLSEYRIFAKDGRLVWMRDQAVLVRDNEDRGQFWHGVMTDISEHHEAKQQLHDVETRHQALIENLPLIAYLEEDGPPPAELLYISPQVEDVLGFPPEDWLKGSGLWSRQVHPDDLERVLELDRKISDSGAPFTFEYRMVAADGHIVWVRDHSVLVKDATGETAYWHGVLQDVTERRETEDALREAEEKYRLLVEQTPAVTYISNTGENASTLYMSPQITDMVGFPPEHWINEGDNWTAWLHPDDRERVRKENLESDRTGTYSTDYRIINPAGEEVWIHDEAVLLRNDDGSPLYWQGVLIDITERRRADALERELDVERAASQRLLALDDMKNTFLTAVSHDLRTPLAAILGLALTLNREDLQLAPKEMQDLIGRIVANARKLDHLVTDLLDLDRLSRGILELSRHPTDVGALVREVVEESDLLGDRPIAVEADSVTVAVDAAKVDRIVENLLANAVRHTPERSQIWVKVRSEDGAAIVIVEDQGPGVPEEHRDAIFEPFRQVGPSDASPGVGIGLSLVARFAELHGGRAWVTERQGGGASFRVLLPPPAEDEPHSA